MDESTKAMADHGILGGVVVGIAWAFRELVSYMTKRDMGGDQQRKITPQDVREEVLKVHAKLESLDLRFSQFQSEEARIHQIIELRLDKLMDECRRPRNEVTS